MQEEYLIYPDQFKQSTTMFISVLFIIGSLFLISLNNMHIVARIFLVLMIGLFLLHLFQLLKSALNKNALYRVNKLGITDYTKKNEELFLSWEEIMKIEIVTNNTSLQIGIVASKTLNDKEIMGQNIKKNMLVNGNMIFYNIIIDGYAFRKKKFNEIFDNIAKIARKSNEKIIINEYVDPLAAKRKTESVS